MSQRQLRFPYIEGKPKEKTREVITGMGRIIVGKLVTNYWKAEEWKINGWWRWARVGPDYRWRVYISARRCGGVCTGLNGVGGGAGGGSGWFGEWNIIGASFHADSTEARRPHLASCMDSVRPGNAAYWTVGYIRTHTYVLRASLYRQTRIWARERTRMRGVYEGKQFTRKRSSFVRSLVACIRPAHIGMHIHVDVLTTRLCMYVFAFMCASSTYTCGFLHFMIYRAAFSGPQSVLKARRLIKEIIEDAK